MVLRGLYLALLYGGGFAQDGPGLVLHRAAVSHGPQPQALPEVVVEFTPLA
jgi:hypothetical protein